jgi:hypothetical protein
VAAVASVVAVRHRPLLAIQWIAIECGPLIVASSGTNALSKALLLKVIHHSKFLSNEASVAGKTATLRGVRDLESTALGHLRKTRGTWNAKLKALTLAEFSRSEDEPEDERKSELSDQELREATWIMLSTPRASMSELEREHEALLRLYRVAVGFLSDIKLNNHIENDFDSRKAWSYDDALECVNE